MSVLNVNQINSQVVGKPPVISDANGLEVGQVCTAWVEFDGATGAIGGSFNVASVSSLTVGWLITFATPMTTVDYTTVGTGIRLTASYAQVISVLPSTTLTTSVSVVQQISTTGATTPNGTIYIAIFGGK